MSRQEKILPPAQDWWSPADSARSDTIQSFPLFTQSGPGQTKSQYIFMQTRQDKRTLKLSSSCSLVPDPVNWPDITLLLLSAGQSVLHHATLHPSEPGPLWRPPRRCLWGGDSYLISGLTRPQCWVPAWRSCPVSWPHTCGRLSTSSSEQNSQNTPALPSLTLVHISEQRWVLWPSHRQRRFSSNFLLKISNFYIETDSLANNTKHSLPVRAPKVLKSSNSFLFVNIVGIQFHSLLLINIAVL